MLGLAPCVTHPKGKVICACPVCGKSVCRECTKRHGHYCSEACRVQAQELKDLVNEEEVVAESLQKAEALTEVLFPWVFKRIPLTILAIALVIGVLYYLDSSGEQRWRVTPSVNAYFLDMARVSTPEGDWLYALRSDGKLLALNGMDGSVKWEASLSGSIKKGGPFLFKDPYMLVPTGEALYCLDSTKGAVLWNRSTENISGIDPALRSDALLIVEIKVEETKEWDLVRSEWMEVTLQNKKAALVCVDPRTGQEIWRQEKGEKHVRYLLAGEEVFFCVLYSPAKYEWKRCSAHTDVNLPKLTLRECEECKQEEAAPSEYVLEALRPTTGKAMWATRLKAGEIDDVRLDGRRLLLRTGQKIYCLDATGKALWDFPLPAKRIGVTYAPDRFFCSLYEGDLICASLETGKENWRVKLPSPVYSVSCGPAFVYAVSHMERPKRETTTAPVSQEPPRRPQDQLMKELMEEGQKETGIDPKAYLSGDTVPVLIAYDISTGKEHWRARKVEGQMQARDGILYVWKQSTSVNLLNAVGGVMDVWTTVYAYSESSDKLYWKYEVNSPSRAFEVGQNSVFLILERVDAKLSVAADDDPVPYDSVIHAVRQREWPNKILKF